MKKTLADWLLWQESLHISEIDLGLERIGKVAERLNLLTPTFPIITVAGTNGKGSTVAFLDTILCAEGYKTGAYTSPHLVNYNERIRLDGAQTSDELIIEAFTAIDKARYSDQANTEKSEEVSLTYFEFSALAAMYIYQQHNVDVAILEVGLGGRLDATNLWDTSLAIITSIGVDHIDWLGDDRELIAIEKAGIMRKNTPAISGDLNPPSTIQSETKRIGSQLQQINSEFFFELENTNKPINSWYWKNSETSLSLVIPKMQGEFQLNNAATAIAGLLSVKSLLPVSSKAINEGLKTAQVIGRLQTLHENPDWLIDVAHNPHAAKQLAKYIKETPKQGKTYALFSMLRDKDIIGVVNEMDSCIDEWHIFPTQGSRGLNLQELKQVFIQHQKSSNNEQYTEQETTQDQLSNIISHENFDDASETVKNIMKDEDRVVAFGCFLVISEILKNYK